MKGNTCRGEKISKKYKLRIDPMKWAPRIVIEREGEDQGLASLNSTRINTNYDEDDDRNQRLNKPWQY